MLSSSDQKAVCGWDTTTSADDYLTHLMKMERALSIAPGVPQYPVVHKAFHNKSPYEEAQAKPSKQRTPRKVSFQDQQRNSDDCLEEIDDEDAETKRSIQQKRRGGFELCKWKTFKGY